MKVQVQGSAIVVLDDDGEVRWRADLPAGVAEWLAASGTARRTLAALLSAPRFRKRLTSAGALRSLVLLLYMRAHGQAPYKARQVVGVSGEQLYRIERAIREEGLYGLYSAGVDLMVRESGARPAPRAGSQINSRGRR